MTWDRFLRQYEAQGQYKGDGYSLADFADMSADELARARSMMLTRALAGDDIDLSGLRYIGDAATVAALDDAKNGAPAQKWDYDITRLDVLFDITGDETYLAALSRYLDGRTAEAQERAAGVLSWRVLPPAAEPFLVDRIADGRHEPALNALLQAWIGLQQRTVCDVMCFQRHLSLIRQVSSASPHRRGALLADAAPGLAPPTA